MTDYEKYLFDELVEEYSKPEISADEYYELFTRFNGLSSLAEVKPYLYTMRFFGYGTQEDRDGVIQELQETQETQEDNVILRGLLKDLLLFEDESNSALLKELKQAEEVGYTDRYLKAESHLHEKEKQKPVREARTDNPSSNMVSLGIMHLRAGDRQKAMRQFEAALQIDTKCVGAYLGLICAANIKEVKPYCQQLSVFDPEEIKIWFDTYPDLQFCVSRCGDYIDRLVLNNGKEETIATILEAGVAASEVTLYLAIKAKYSKELIKALIDKGANPNGSVNHKYESGFAEELFPLTAAVVDAKDIEIVRLLIERGADAACAVRDTTGNVFPLINDAVRDNNSELVELLLNSGANANAGQISLNVDNYGMGNEFSALQEAIVNNCDLKIIKNLLDHGANPNYCSYARAASGKRKVGNSICDAIWYSDTPADVVKLLLESGADPKAVWTDFCPVGVGYCPVNASVSRGDYYLCTIPVLALALMTNETDVAQLLLDSGASMDDKCAIKNDQGYETRHCTVAQCSSAIQRTPETMQFIQNMLQPTPIEAPKKKSWFSRVLSLEEKSPLEQTVYYIDTKPSEDPYDLVYHWVQ